MTRPTAAVARHALLYGTGSVVGGVTRAVLLPVIARTLSTGEYGVLSLLLAATNFLHLIFELGLVGSTRPRRFASNDMLDSARALVEPRCAAMAQPL